MKTFNSSEKSYSKQCAIEDKTILTLEERLEMAESCRATSPEAAARPGAYPGNALAPGGLYL